MCPFHSINYIPLYLGIGSVIINTCKVLGVFLPMLRGLWAVSPQPGIKPVPHALETWNPNQWISREVLKCKLLCFKHL